MINPTRVNQPGWIVAFTVGLSKSLQQGLDRRR